MATAATRFAEPKSLPVVGHLHRVARSGRVGYPLSVSRDAGGSAWLDWPIEGRRFHQDVLGFGK